MSARHHCFALLGALIALTACSTTGATFRSGVGDAYPERAPYYAGKAVAPAARVGFVPITFQRDANGTASFDPNSAAGSALAALVADMNAYLDSLGVATKLGSDATPVGTPPDVQFGCIRTTGSDCDERSEDQALGKGPNRNMRLAVGRPSAEWTTWAASEMTKGGVPNALVITVETSDYFLRQKGLRGSKQVELGTGYTVPLPWLTGLETPVSVLQLTGALMNADGTAVRIGAEGMLARQTGILAGAIGGQRIVTEKDVAELRTARRTDLAGHPLVWQVALRNLVAGLTGRTELATR
jgi:hypothetical protein